MEEDIKRLENYINGKDTMKETLVEAIENLIARYKELEEQQNKNIRVAYGGRRYNTEGIILKDFVPKSKVKEKIEELEKERKKQDEENIINVFYDQIDITHIIEALQELLED